MARGALEDKKAVDIVMLDVRKLSNVTDYYLVATGNSPPHIKALSEEVVKVLKEAGVSCFRKSGTAESEWLVADFVDFVVHIFSPDMRKYYELEQLWSDAAVID